MYGAPRHDMLNPAQREIIDGMEPFVATQLELLNSAENCWQPSDYLPESTGDNWPEQVRELRDQAKSIPDELLVVLVGDMVTEEALPTYQSLLNGFEGVSDRSGSDASAWARWTRGWTAEENRHGDLLNRYLYLSGRVDLRAVEVTIQNLIIKGFDPGTTNNPYRGFVYTSFQERATKVSHHNVSKLARAAGDETLQLICNTIASDEARHERAYTNFMGYLFEKDPVGAVLAFRDVLQSQIVMPAQNMGGASEPDLFERFSTVAQRLGVYTAEHYAQIVTHLVERWRVESLAGLTGEAAAAQEYVCTLGPRYRRLAERASRRATPEPPQAFSWIFGRAA